MNDPTIIAAAANDDRLIAIAAPVAIVAGDPDAATGAGGPAKFTVDAYTGGKLIVANYDLPVAVDLATLRFSNSLVANLDHVTAQRVGHVTATVNDGKSLTMAGVASAATASRDEVVKSAKDGFNWQASIEAKPDLSALERIAAGQSIEINGQSLAGPMYVARNAMLRGFAFVSHGADDDTKAKIAAAAAKDKGKENMDPEFVKWIKAMGIDPDHATPEILATCKANWEGFNKKPEAKPEPEIKAGSTVDEIVAAQKTENARQERILNFAREAMADNPGAMDTIQAMANAAIKDRKISAEAFELDMYRQRRHVSRPRIGPPGGGQYAADVIECAICQTGKLENIDKHFSPQVLEAAEKQFRHGIGLQQLLTIAARAAGLDVTSVKAELLSVLRACFPIDPRAIQAEGATSTISLPTTFSNIANKFLLQGWMAIDQTWRAITGVSQTNDFKLQTRFSLTGDMVYEAVGPGGEIKHGKVGETVYTNQVGTYAKMFGISRQDIINDDMGALTGVPNRLGRGAALALNKIFWTIFLNNSNFFKSGNNNVSTGGGSALSIDGLTAAEKTFLKQTDPDGQPLGIEPKILLVPVELKATAASLMTSELVVSGNTALASGLPNANVFRGRFDYFSTPYLSNTAYTGNSTAAWYLLASPADLPVIDTAFLNGRESPIIETAQADFDILGIVMRGYHDFGVALQEFRGGVRSAGS